MDWFLVLLAVVVAAVVYYLAVFQHRGERGPLDQVAAELGLRRTRSRLHGTLDGVDVEAEAHHGEHELWVTYSVRPPSMPSMRVDTRRRKDGDVVTGDHSFDDRFRLRDANPEAVAWLNSRRRAAMIDLADETAGIELRNGQITTMVDGRLGAPAETVAWIRRLVDLAHGR